MTSRFHQPAAALGLSQLVGSANWTIRPSRWRSAWAIPTNSSRLIVTSLGPSRSVRAGLYSRGHARPGGPRQVPRHADGSPGGGGDRVAAGAASGPSDALDLVPLADGGEGTLEALVPPEARSASCGARVTGPLGGAVEAEAGIRDGIGVVEMARASGLELVAAGASRPRARDDPRHRGADGRGRSRRACRTPAGVSRRLRHERRRRRDGGGARRPVPRRAAHPICRTAAGRCCSWPRSTCARCWTRSRTVEVVGRHRRGQPAVRTGRARARSSGRRRARGPTRCSCSIGRSGIWPPSPRTTSASIDRRERRRGRRRWTGLRPPGLRRRPPPSGGRGRDGGGRVPGTARRGRPGHHGGGIAGRTVLAGQGTGRRVAEPHEPPGVRAAILCGVGDGPAGGRRRAVARRSGRPRGGDGRCPPVAGAARPGARARARRAQPVRAKPDLLGRVSRSPAATLAATAPPPTEERC